MEFVRGNRALRDHADAGEDVHLFEQETGGLRYFGQMSAPVTKSARACSIGAGSHGERSSSS
jgi:hypothetical protein